MRLSVIMAALAAAAPAPGDPGRLWIWPDRAEAEQWARENPGLCIRRVPDGFATERCSRKPNRLRIHVGTEAEAKRLSVDDQLGRHFDCLQFIPATGALESC
jgi:hypothetical protein